MIINLILKFQTLDVNIFMEKMAREVSDIDLHIERGRMKSLLQYFAFIDELESVLNCHVDVVTTGIEDKQFLSSIMKEGVLLYGE